MRRRWRRWKRSRRGLILGLPPLARTPFISSSGRLRQERVGPMVMLWLRRDYF